MAIVRNLTLIKCTPGYPMFAPVGSAVFGTVLGHQPITVERERVAAALTAVRTQKQITDFPTIVSAPPHERRT